MSSNKSAIKALTLTVGSIGMVGLAMFVFFGIDYLATVFFQKYLPVILHWSPSYIASVPSNYYYQFAYVAITYGLIGLTLASWLLYHKAQNRAVLGYVHVKPRAFGWVPLGLITYYIITGVTIAILSGISRTFKSSTVLKQQIGLDTIHGHLEIFLALLLLMIIDPLIEELVFRGIIFTSLKQKFPVLIAALGTSILFALPHMIENNYGLLYVLGVATFVMSMILCWLRQKTGSLYPGMVLHGSANGITVLALILTTHK